MEAVNAVSRWLQKWKSGGEQECRVFVSPHHLKLTDSVSSATVFSVYQALLYATVATWTGKAKLTGSAFTNFVKSAVDGMPSTSSASPSAVDPMRATFGEHLVDIIWALDIDLDEVAIEVKAASASSNPEAVKRSASKKGEIVEADRVMLADITRALLVAGVIDKYIAAERLEFPLLKRVNLIQDDKDSNKKEVRMRTRLFYKQNKFNLLREQSEGYSKLTTELTSSLGPPHSPATARPVEALEDVSERTKAVWDKIISIVGYFDLDPNRALDIILDVFSTHIATHHAFFLALLACSPWAGAYQSRSPRAMELDTQTPSFDGKNLEEILTLMEHATSPEKSNDQRSRVLAQVLGFKFAYYNGVEPSEVTPRNLYMTAALLIREGFITLEDLYPHLVANDPEDEGKAAYKATIAERISALRVSNLAMAAPLDSMAPSTNARPKTVEQESAQAPIKEPPTQTMGIISALLSVGSVKPALWLLAKYPWMVDAFPEIADVTIRVARASVTPLYEETLKKPHNPSWLQPRARFTTTGVVPPPQRKPVLTIRAPTPPSTASTDFVFFFPDWEQSIPICTKLDDLIPIIEPLLMVIKLHVTRDLVFLTKLCRLARKHIESIGPSADTEKPDPNDPIRQFWYKMLRLVLIPGLSAMHGSAVINVEIWNLMKLYETSERWRLYGEWKSSIYQQHSELAVRRVEADREAKDILRRVSGTTIEVMSNAIGKLVSTNPCLFFTPAVNQIMAYDGALPDNVAKALRGITQLGYDVLNFTILEALAGSRQRVQEDGLTISPWLTRLSAFTGKLYRTYAVNVESILEYIVHQLHNRSTADIEVLRALILQMTDIEPLPSLTDGQVQAMSGGPYLCIETVASEKRGASHPLDKNYGRPAERFGKALVSSKLALPLLVEVAQQRQTAVFSSPSTHLKSLAKLYDLTHNVLGQYLNVLTTSWIPLEVYATQILPPLGDLGDRFGICAPVCMQIYRPVLTEKILVKWVALDKQESAERERSLKEAMKAKRNATSSAASRVASPVTGKTTNEPQPAVANGTNASTPISAAPETAPAPMDVDVAAPVLLTATAPGSPWLPELEVHFAEVKRLLPDKVYNTLGPGFYLTFWQLSMYDLAPPIASYEQAVALLRSRARKEDDQAREIARANRTHRSRAYLDKQDQYDKGIENLQSEMKTQCISRTYTIRRFATEKMHWFAGSTVTPNALLEVFLEHCLIPRCLMSPMDAEYAAQMVRAMHNAGTPGFHTMACYDMLLKDLPATIVFSCSEDEARNYGRFLRSVLADLHKWHKDESTYLSDNRIKSHGKSLPGMRMRFRVDKEPILHSQFQQVLRKWHQKLVNSFTDCFKTGEYMHVYNSILVLNAMLPEFPMPTIAQHSGKMIKSTMEAFLAKETREDVSQLGASYLAGLKKEERKWPDLHKEKATAPKDKVPTAPKEKDLNVAAAPFKPRASPAQANSSPAHSNGNSDTKRSNGALPISTSTPSAPRAHQSLPPRPAQGASKSSTEPPRHPEVPRPELIRRVQRDTGSPAPPTDMRPTSANIPTGPKDETHRPQPAIRTAPGPEGPPSRGPSTPLRHEIQPMPPPNEPSQTSSAQHLRDAALQSRGDKEKDSMKVDDPRDKRAVPMESSRSRNASPRRRSISPRPGTRSSSLDSRGSRHRKDADDQAKDKDKSRLDDRRAGGRDASPVPLQRRDSLSLPREREGTDRHKRDRHDGGHRGENRERERPSDREKERERDRGSDRNGTDRHRRSVVEEQRDRHGKEREPTGGMTSIRGAANLAASASSRDELKRKRDEDGPTHNGDRDARRSTRKEGHRDSERGSSGRRDKERDDRPGGRERRRDNEGRSRRERSEERTAPPAVDKRAETDNRPPTPRGLPSQPRADRAPGGPPTPTASQPPPTLVSAEDRAAKNDPPQSPQLLRGSSLLDRIGDGGEGGSNGGGRGPPPSGPRVSDTDRSGIPRKRQLDDNNNPALDKPLEAGITTSNKRARTSSLRAPADFGSRRSGNRGFDPIQTHLSSNGGGGRRGAGRRNA